MICIHPSATHNFGTLAALKQRTGLKIVRGNTFLRLESHTGAQQVTPRPRTNSLTTTSDNWTPGGAA